MSTLILTYIVCLVLSIYLLVTLRRGVCMAHLVRPALGERGLDVVWCHVSVLHFETPSVFRSESSSCQKENLQSIYKTA